MKIFEYHGQKNISGERIHLARRKMKLTQAELAAQLQIKGVILERESISRIEIGDRFIADFELRAIAEILKVDVNWLLGIDLDHDQTLGGRGL